MAARICSTLRPSRHLSGIRNQISLRELTTSHWLSTHSLEPDGIAAVLSKPSWSVKSVLRPSKSIHPERITQIQLHHLLRLSALPLPKSEKEELRMIKDLQSQLHFVQAIQKVDTDGVKPLQSIRDETKKFEMENMITLESLQAELDKEVIVGKRGRIKKKEGVVADPNDAENWDPLAHAPKKMGRYFVVETDRD